ncbi:MAG: zinc ribbon domain-containing protein, partial [Prevotella sp.]|nr:zinc ribbon domain-containing protein [Prevotella sp.]
ILVRQQPEEKILDLQTDSFTVVKDEQLVVADFRIIPTDSIDSVWVQVATVMSDFGWVHESQLLESVVPDDPISQFISTFSDKHLLIFIIIISIITSIYIIRKIARLNAHIVHFNDIDSFYPTLLTIIVASSATLYASIQNFAPDTWRHFYYHPTLNPFSVPLILTVFLMSVWALLIVGLTVVDVVRNHLPLGEALLYLGGLAGICAVDYIIFSITSLYYLGYVLLIAYIVFAIHQYYKHNHKYFLCGNCGGKIRKKGRCPHCGATNL